MFGWTDPNLNIRIPIRTFQRTGWADATYAHEVAHWILENNTGFGSARRAVTLLVAAVNVTHWNLGAELRALAAAMHRCSFITHEAVATVTGLSFAASSVSQDLAEDIADSLDETYRDCHQRIAPLLDRWGVPNDVRGKIAKILGLLAMGSDIRRDWSNPTLDLDELFTSLKHHAPDTRLERIVGVLIEQPPMWRFWAYDYQDGGPMAMPECLDTGMPFDIPQMSIMPSVELLLKRFQPRLARLFRDKLAEKADATAARIVDTALRIVSHEGLFPCDPYWRISVVPDRSGARRLSAAEATRELWANAQLAVVHCNDQPHPLPRPSDGKNVFEPPGVLLPGQAEVTLYSGETVLRFIVEDAVQLQAGLNSLDPKSAVLVDTTSALRHAFQMSVAAQAVVTVASQEMTPTEWACTLDDPRTLLFPNEVRSAGPIGLLFIGCFKDLLEAISPFIHERHPAQAILVPSDLAQRHADSGNLQDLKIGAYGYFVLKLAIPRFPLLYWPTTVMAAERVLGDRVMMQRMGINVLDQRTLTTFFSPPSEVVPMVRLKQYFEESTDMLAKQ